MKVFKRIQAIAAFVAMWIGIAVSSNNKATDNEILVSAALVIVAGMMVINILIERSKEELK